MDYLKIFSESILPIVSLLVGGFLAVFVFYKFSPVIILRITYSWEDSNKEHLLVKYEIENKSNVRLKDPTVSTQFLVYKLKKYSELSEWVPFEKKRIIEKETPIDWNEPKSILTKTKRIYPNEIITTERYYHIQKNNVAIHLAIKIKVKLGIVGKILTRKKEDWSQTRTIFIIKST